MQVVCLAEVIVSYRVVNVGVGADREQVIAPVTDGAVCGCRLCVYLLASRIVYLKRVAF